MILSVDWLSLLAMSKIKSILRSNTSRCTWGCIFAGIACWMVSVGCSQAGRERLAHFFFEIPDESSNPSIAAPAGGTAVSNPPAGVPSVETTPAPRLRARFVSMHPPYALRQCDQCHNTSANMQAREDLLDSCKNCHARYFSEEVGHSPVEMGQCIECHEMHQSGQPGLLKMAAIDLCIECHDEPEDLSEPAHAVEGAQRCLACHDPHFGANPLLVPNPTITIPAVTTPD